MARERPTDDLLRRILDAAVAEAAGPRVRRLVDAARAEAEDEVKALVKSAIKATLLRRAAEHLESIDPLDVTPAPALRPAELDDPTTDGLPGALTSELDGIADREGHERAPGPQAPTLGPAVPPTAAATAADDAGPVATACYVYAISAAGPQTWTQDTPGIDPAHPLELVGHGDVQAVVSRVSLGEFGQASLDGHATDPLWVEAKVRAHDHVVTRATAAAAGGGAVIPCRFCTVVRNPEDVRRLLATHAEDIRATLAALHGKEEWGVKVYAQPGSAATRLAHELVGAEPDRRSGRAYLQRRKQEVGQRGELAQAVWAHAEACHAELAAVAADATVLPRHRHKPGGRDSEPVLKAAYLVPVEDVGRFHDVVAELDKRHQSFGLRFELTGPWPPYNFARLNLSSEAAA